MNRQPFFILGVQRSGTTMLRLMLNNHPRLAVPHESKFILTFQPVLPKYGELTRRENVARLLDDIAEHPAVKAGALIVSKDLILQQPINSYADLVDVIMRSKAEALGKARWGDKTPFYTPSIDILWHLFPQAKIVHLVRDGRDVLLSHQKVSWLSNSLPKIAADWRWMATICHKVGSVRGPEWFLEVKYEDLVRQPEATLRRICAFLDEDFAPDMLEYHHTARQEVPSESLRWHQSSVESPNPSKLFQWKTQLSRADRVIFEQVAGDTLALFGYELENLESTWGSRARNLYYSMFVRW